MEFGFSILMFCFAGAILLYAGLIAFTRSTRLIKHCDGENMERPGHYAAQFAKLLALVAVAPALAGVAALVNGLFAFIVLVVSLVVFIWAGNRFFMD